MPDRQPGRDSGRDLDPRQPDLCRLCPGILAWPIAVMLVDGEIGPRQMLEEHLSDPVVKDLARKVEVVESEEPNRLCRLYEKGDPEGCFASTVTIRLRDGREFTSGLKDGGMALTAGNWSREEMADKFLWLAGNVMEQERAEEVLDMAWHLDELDSVGELTAKLK